MNLQQKLKDTWKKKKEDVELYRSYVQKRLSRDNIYMTSEDYYLTLELCCYYPFESYWEVLYEEIGKHYNDADRYMNDAKKSIQVQAIVRPILEASPNDPAQIMVFVEKLKDEKAFKELDIPLIDRIEAAIPAAQELTHISCFLEMWNALCVYRRNDNRGNVLDGNYFSRILWEKVYEIYLSDKITEEDMKVQTQLMFTLIEKMPRAGENSVLKIVQWVRENAKVMPLKILCKELKQKGEKYQPIKDIINEALFAFEKIENGKSMLLPGQIVVDPSDQSSLIAAIDEEIRLIQDSKMIEAVRKRNGHYAGSMGSFFKGDFVIEIGKYNEKGLFQLYSYGELSPTEMHELLAEFEEGRKRLYTYVKLMTVYLQYNIVPDFIITGSEILQAYKLLCLLRKDPEAHYLFPAYQLGVDEWRDLTEEEPCDHHEMVYECIKDCKEVIHTMLYLFYSGNHYMNESLRENMHKFPYERFLEDEEWMEEMHRAFAAAYIDKNNMEYCHRRTVEGEWEEVDIDEVEEDFEDFFKDILSDYVDYYLEEDVEILEKSPEEIIKIYADIEGDEIENLDEERVALLQQLSKLYPVFCELDKRLDVQKIRDIVSKTVSREIDFPRPYGPKIDLCDIPELFSDEALKALEKMLDKKSFDTALKEEALAAIELEDNGDILRKVKQSYIQSF